MLVRLAYLVVIMIWATTPLAIKLGSETLAPVAGLTLRMALALAVGCVVSTVCGFTSLALRRNWKLYFAASISIFPNMVLVYQAAQYLPSGLISLMFGLTPFFTAVLARPILGEDLLQPRKLLAIGMAVVGLVVILQDNVLIASEGALFGFGLMLLSNVLFSGSALWVKKLNATITVTPFEQSLGAMAFSLPGLALFWVYGTGIEPLTFTATSLGSLLYLALIASLVGFAAYYYILQHMSVDTVALVPLITPVLAICIGVIFLGESASWTLLIGSAMVLLALAVHQGLLSKPALKPATELVSPVPEAKS
ncbi:DMT family transporter [Pseudomaricurvus sp. HS19]|uniref:DMT family transporter n=1 Tax=Pseudomaricurvus sp. HS19 TaxID=2692626 RepID=UPI00136C8CDD|nr:DMT family transporter [Pseudomaricurvus sp. HS19]MYM62260.1 EamA family transporter [Pseudomaricurvus sp. HS19]